MSNSTMAEKPFKIGEIVTERNHPRGGTYIVLSLQWDGEHQEYDVTLLSQDTGKKAWLWASALTTTEENDENE